MKLYSLLSIGEGIATMNDHEASGSASMENVWRAHERVKSIRIEYEAARAAAGTPTWQSIQNNLLLRARYTEAIDQFLAS